MMSEEDQKNLNSGVIDEKEIKKLNPLETK
jgi:hypothetical protein